MIDIEVRVGWFDKIIRSKEMEIIYIIMIFKKIGYEREEKCKVVVGENCCI